MNASDINVGTKRGEKKWFIDLIKKILIKINYIGGKLSNKNRGGYGTTGVE